MLYLLLAYLILLPIDEILLIVDDLLTAGYSFPQPFILQRFFSGHTFMQIDVGTVKVHAHLHPRGLHLGPLCDRLIDFSSGLQLLYIFLVVLHPAGKCSIFGLAHRHLLFQLEQLVLVLLFVVGLQRLESHQTRP